MCVEEILFSCHGGELLSSTLTGKDVAHISNYTSRSKKQFIVVEKVSIFPWGQVVIVRLHYPI